MPLPLAVQSLEPRLALSAVGFRTIALASSTDSVAPEVRSITPPKPRVYAADQTLSFKVNFTERVEVTGSPTLPITIGANVRQATWNGLGSGNKSLMFTLDVQSGDFAPTGVRVAGPIDLSDGAAIRDRAGNVLNPAASGTFRRARVDAVGPRVSDFGQMAVAGKRVSMRVTFTEPVTVRGKPSISFTLDGAPRQLVYARGSGSNVLVFTYRATRREMPTVDNVAVSALMIAPNRGRIIDEAGNAAATVLNGKLLKVEQLPGFDTAQLNAILTTRLKNEFLAAKNPVIPLNEFDGKYATATTAVSLYKITYQSSIPEKNGAPTELTGLVAIPAVQAAGTPMISYQHGTVFEKDAVPSNIEKSLETMLPIAQFGGQGYVVIAADYLGLGDSRAPHAYFSQPATVRACVDMYTAAQELLAQRQVSVANFFTLGWSQGAYNTLAFSRALERANVPVRAVVTAATPGDPNFFITRGIVAPRTDDNATKDAIWIPAGFAMMLFSYEEYAGLQGLTARAIKTDYLEAARKFYSFEMTFEEFFKATTPLVVDFLNPEFIEAMRLGTEPLAKALNDAEGYRWRTLFPLRSYYGEQDEAITPDLATIAIDYQKALGNENAEAILADRRADHRNTYAIALYDAKPWIDSKIVK